MDLGSINWLAIIICVIAAMVSGLYGITQRYSSLPGGRGWVGLENRVTQTR